MSKAQRIMRLDPELTDKVNHEAPRRRLIGIALLPSAATLGNLLCGVLAILCGLMSMRVPYFDANVVTKHPHLSSLFPSYITIGAYLMVLAMIFDVLDGRLARMARRTSEFGAQLDSIADIVSFGVAPTLLFLAMLVRPLTETDSDPVSSVQWQVSLLCALVYVSCAAIRLARYNAENVKDESAQKRFSGLPSPGAAGAFAALLLLHEDLIQPPEALAFGVDWANVVRWAIPPVIFCLGMLMVSRLNYVHVMNRYLRREQPLIYLVALVILAPIAYFHTQIMLVVVAYAYVFSGIWRSFKRPAALAAEDVAGEEG